MMALIIESNNNHEEIAPYLSLDISKDRKLLMSQWFQQKRQDNEKNRERKTLRVHGPRIDQRALPSTNEGNALAVLHCANTSLNLMFRRWNGVNMHSSFKDYNINHLCDRKHQERWDRTTALAETFGPELCIRIMKNLMKDYGRGSEEYPTITDTVNDQHPMYSSLIGRDVGMPFTYPVACAMSYAIQGKCTAVEEITKSLGRFWDAYAEALEREGTDDAFVHKAYRNGLGWGGWFLYMSYYRMNAYTHVLPLKGVSNEDQKIVIDSIGVVGLKMMSWGFGGYEKHLSLKQLRKSVDEFLREEVDTLLDVHEVNQIHVKGVVPAPPNKSTTSELNFMDILSLGFWFF